MKSNAGTVSAYIAELAPDRKSAFETLRAMIEKAAPEAKSTMKYGLPTWEWKGPLFALASRAHDMELYVNEPDAVARRKKTLGEVEVGKASVRFRLIGDLNLAIVEALLFDAADRRKGGAKAGARGV